MGLAASQARFLCITSRKADCEYKSTELAQQKLEITNQLSAISTEYSNAMNATKLMWSNEAVEGDFGLTYSLLMMPSAANDYNPYMITSPSGAIVLNSEYAAAAKAAGISKAGGVGSQESRDKFIQALVPGGLITQETADAITMTDFDAVKNPTDNSITVTKPDNSNSNFVQWDPAAGMGRNPLDKSSADAMSLADLILSESIGQQTIDWGKVVAKDNQVTQKEKDKEIERYNTLIGDVDKNKITSDIVSQLVRDRNNYKKANTDKSGTQEYLDKIRAFDELIANAKKVMAGETRNGLLLDNDGNTTSVAVADVIAAVKKQLEEDKALYDANTKAETIDNENYFNYESNSLDSKQFSVVENGIINHYKDEVESMTIGDILSGNIVLMSKGANKEEFAKQVTKLLESLAATLGYSASSDLTGQGLNVDDASAKALKFAFEMTKKTFLNPNDAVDTGSRDSKESMVDNSAYQNAVNNNRIGFVDGKKGAYCAVSLTNMLSSFLTYYENALTGANSNYVVGSSVETSVYVTDDAGYIYMAQASKDAVTAANKKSADFFDELYNNILEHGWREDAAIDDAEYLESAIKDGRYSMSSLNQDGYYYQTRYNETGYIVEVSDTDAIARAEAEFTSKKAELTYKEDSIDLKSKKLDAEISSLTTEYDTVKNLISKSIEKTFTLFSN